MIVLQVTLGRSAFSHHRSVFLGSEMLRLQGLYPEELAGSQLSSSEKQFADLAGNAFSSVSVSAAMLALLGSLQFDSQSENEELENISSAFSALSGMTGSLG